MVAVIAKIVSVEFQNKALSQVVDSHAVANSNFQQLSSF
jgi:hypothetical protein